MARWTLSWNKLSRPAAGAALTLAALGLATTSSHTHAAEQPASAQPATAQPVEVGLTKPADLKPRELQFKTIGLIKSVLVKEGDLIKEGQPLVALDDAEELAELDILKKDISNIRITAAETQATVKKFELSRLQKVAQENGGNDLEIKKAEAEAELAELNIVQEKNDLEVKRAKVTKQEIVLSRMTMNSPIAGVVLSVDSHVGEMVDPNKPAIIKIVNNDPLVVELKLATSVSQRLKVNQTLRVSYDKKDWREAKISFLSPMADDTADMQIVHLQMANPEGRASGLQVFVELPPALATAR
jgi:RND family efflux transporter MFP subunit